METKRQQTFELFSAEPLLFNEKWRSDYICSKLLWISNRTLLVTCFTLLVSHLNLPPVLQNKWQMFCNSRRINARALFYPRTKARSLLSASSVFQLRAQTKGFILQRVIKLLSSQFIWALEKSLSHGNVRLCPFHALSPARRGKQGSLCAQSKVRSL